MTTPVFLEKITALINAIGADIKAIYAKYKNGVRLFRTMWAATGTYHLPSFWRSLSGTSQSMAQNTYIAAVPVDCEGLDIQGVAFHVQGGISGSPIMYLGVFDSDPETGAPTDLLGEASYTITSAGTKIVNIPVAKGSHGKRVWIAWFLKLTSSAVQLSISSATQTGGLDFLLPTSNGVNGVFPAALLSNTTFPGSYMPSTFGVYGFGTTQVCPNLTLVVSP